MTPCGSIGRRRAARPAARPESGLTLVEVTIAIVLASIVMVGLVGFYLSSQATWIESSTQAVTQREGTLLLERISSKVRGASGGIASLNPDADHMRLVLNDISGDPIWSFWWSASDSTIHHGPGALTDQGSLVSSKVTRFQVSVTGGSLVLIPALDLLSPTGAAIEMSTAAALYNRP